MALPDILTGKTDEHVALIPGEKIAMHREALGALSKMQAAATKQGFDLKVVSGFRDFASQLRIWNLKATGQRALLDKRGQPLDFAKLSPPEVVFAILRWSALPGASRHHWGTDIDVIDAKAVPDGYQVQLIPAEVAPKGMFGKLHAWLDDKMEDFGFFRPYAEDLGGVSPERWHLSYAPIAEKYYDAHTLELLEGAVEASDMALKDVVLDHLPEIFEQYVANVSPP